MEIVPGVHQVEGVTGSNSVLLAGKEMALVDTGIPGNGQTILSYIKNLGRDPADLRWIILTHAHHDHSGSAAELHQLTGARIVAHQDETQQAPDGQLMLRKASEGESVPSWYLWAMGGRGRRSRQAVHYPETIVHEPVKEGDVIPTLGGLRILHAPGHTPGSMYLLLEGEQRVVFLGDSVLNNGNRVSRPLTWSRAKRRQLDSSLVKLRNLEAQVACFGHGPVLTQEVGTALRSLTDRPYNLPTWLIVLKNWPTLQRWRARVSRPGHWQGGRS